MPTTLLLLALGMIQPGWSPFLPDGKAYRVEMLGPPDRVATRTVTHASGRSELTTASWQAPEGTYLIQVTEHPAPVDPGTLDEGVRRFASAARATLGPVATIVVDGHPGRDFEATARINGTDKRTKYRWVAAGNSLYMLSAASKPGGKVPADAGRFLGSLALGADRLAELARATPSPSPAVEPARSADRGRDKAGDRDKAMEFAGGDGAGEAEVEVEAARPAEKEKPAPRKAQAKVSIGRIPRDAKEHPAEDLVDLSRSSFGRDRDGFRDLGPAGSVLVGVRVTYIERFGGFKVRSAQPIYRSGAAHYQGQVHGEAVGPVLTFLARPGYAIGGLVTHIGLTVDGFGIVYMKVDGDRLDPGDSYKSPWIGDKRGGNPGEVFSTGGLVVGLQGKAGSELNGLGLTALK